MPSYASRLERLRLLKEQHERLTQLRELVLGADSDSRLPKNQPDITAEIQELTAALSDAIMGETEDMPPPLAPFDVQSVLPYLETQHCHRNPGELVRIEIERLLGDLSVVAGSEYEELDAVRTLRQRIERKK